MHRHSIIRLFSAFAVSSGFLNRGLICRTCCTVLLSTLVALSLHAGTDNSGEEGLPDIIALNHEQPINTLRQLGPGVWQESGIAIMGYDPVSYFLNHRATKGSMNYKFSWRGATWYFSSAANRDIFIKNPEVFAPQYGGYSAHGVANGYLVKIDPYSWAVVDGKLYLNYKDKFHRHWLRNSSRMIDKANQQYPDLLVDLAEPVKSSVS